MNNEGRLEFLNESIVFILEFTDLDYKVVF